MAKINETEYYKLQMKLGWTNIQASVFFEVNVTTIRRWRNGNIRTPKAVIVCLSSLINKCPVKNPRFKVQKS